MEEFRPKYRFSLAFQKKVLATMVRESLFIQEYRPCFKSNYFDKSLQELAKAILGIFDGTKCVPTLDTLTNYLAANNIEVSDEDLVTEIFNVELPDVSVIRSMIIEFAKKASIRSGILQATDLIDQDADLPKIYRTLEESMRVGSPVSPGIEFFSVTPEQVLNTPQYQGKPRNTGFANLDKCINGLRIGDVFVVMGTSGKGKSILLMNIGYHNLAEDGDVYHFTIGDLREEDVYSRYLSRITHIPVNDIINNPKSPQIAKEMDRFNKCGPGKLMIKYLPPLCCTVADIRSLCTTYRSKLGRGPKVIIVDYPDELITLRRSGSYEDMGEIYSELKSLGHELECPIIGASQINRTGFRAALSGEAVDQDVISDSMKKINKADTIVSLAQTKEERQLDSEGYQTMRVYLAKVRRGIDCKTLCFRVNKAKMEFIPAPDPEVEE